MANIDYLYDDPNWLLQAGLGDIEFEQDMYDDIVYGEPAEHEDWKRKQLLRSMYYTDTPEELADYDELALMGLRRHSMQGPLRYLYDEKQKEARKSGYLGQTSRTKSGMGALGDGSPNQMDLNLDQILYGTYNKGYGQWDPSQGPLQDYISDIYRHEYKHPLFTRRLEKHVGSKYDLGIMDRASHATTAATGALFNKSRQQSEMDYNRMNMSPNINRRVAAGMIDYAKRKNPHLNTPPGSAPPTRAQQRLNAGGLASLMV
tara:strand:+ start:1180 stop:1959 length:780 start_codon:yes stop_codon:yes gene_type:complete